MTVAELREQIKDLPDDVVIHMSTQQSYRNTSEVGSVEYFSSNELWIYSKD